MSPSFPSAARHLALCLLAYLVTEGSALNLLEWNPHWECFADSHRQCQRHAEQTLSEVLATRYVDFANLVELEDRDYIVPEGWLEQSHRCGRDMVTLVHNSRRWSPSTRPGSIQRGCMDVRDRAFLVQQFDENPVYGDRKLVVVGAHYPHGYNRDVLREALSAVVKATDVTSVVLIADTNEVRKFPSSEVMHDIDAPAGNLRATALRSSCCYSSHFDWSQAFDRIITNFGSERGTDMLLEDLPAWAKAGAFHRPILAVGPTVTTTSTSTTVPTTTVTTTAVTTSTSTTTIPGPGLGMKQAVGAVAGVGALGLCIIGFMRLQHSSRMTRMTSPMNRQLTTSQGEE